MARHTSLVLSSESRTERHDPREYNTYKNYTVRRHTNLYSYPDFVMSYATDETIGVEDENTKFCSSFNEKRNG